MVHMEMRLEYLNDGTIRATLSRRNVAVLLYKLEVPWSHRGVVGGDVYADGRPIDGHALVIRSREDDQPAACGLHGQVVVTLGEDHSLEPGVHACLTVDLARSALEALIAAVDSATAGPGEGTAREVSDHGLAARKDRFVLAVELDVEHYARRTEPPSLMVLETELALLDGGPAADRRASLDEIEIVLAF